MGGKSRKSGGISKALISRIVGNKCGKGNSNGTKGSRIQGNSLGIFKTNKPEELDPELLDEQ